MKTMLRILVKNYLRLIFRDYVSWAICILVPIFLIFITSTALKQGFVSEVRIEEMIVGYSGEKPELVDEKITFSPISKEEAIKQIADGRLIGYIEEANGKMILYLPEYMNNESIYLRNKVTLMLAGITEEKIKVGEKLIHHTYLEAKTPISSKEYYGRILLTYCVWIGAVFAGRIAILERRDRAIIRIRQSQISGFTWWLARWIATFIGYSIAVFIIVLWLNMRMQMDWDEYVGKIVLLVGLMMICFTVLNTFLSFVFKTEAAFVTVTSIVWMLNGFLGGSFQNYWYNFIPEDIQELSIIYYMNRSIIEVSTYGESRYLNKCIFLMLFIMLISSLLSIFYIRRERKQDV